MTEKREYTSKYKGVYWCVTGGYWKANIRHKTKLKYLGRFIHEKDAAEAYDLAAIECNGDFARLNFPISSRKKYSELSK